jgi:hypothetical protein
MSNEYKVESFGVEVLHTGGQGKAAVAQFAAEVLRGTIGDIKTESFGVEVLRSITSASVGGTGRRRNFMNFTP